MPKNGVRRFGENRDCAEDGPERLWKECCAQGVHMVFSHVNSQPMSVLEKAGFVQWVGKDNFQPNIDAALERGMQLENEPVPETV